MYVCIYIIYYIYICVTGYCKTNRIATLGLFHYVGPADSYTHTLPVHCCIDRPSWLVCFSRAGFADHVKSFLAQWAHGGNHMGGKGLIFTPVLVTRLLSHPGLSGLMTSISWTHGTSIWSCWKLSGHIIYMYIYIYIHTNDDVYSLMLHVSMASITLTGKELIYKKFPYHKF